MTEIPDLPAIAPANVSDDDLILIYDVGAAMQHSRKATRAHFLKDVVRTAGEFSVEKLNATDSLNAPTSSIDDLTVNTKLVMGASVTKILTASGSVTIPDADPADQVSVTMTVTGAVVNDVVTVSAPAALPKGLILRAVVTAPNVATIYALNVTATKIDTASYLIRLMLVRFA